MALISGLLVEQDETPVSAGHLKSPDIQTQGPRDDKLEKKHRALLAMRQPLPDDHHHSIHLVPRYIKPTRLSPMPLL